MISLVQAMEQHRRLQSEMAVLQACEEYLRTFLPTEDGGPPKNTIWLGKELGTVNHSAVANILAFLCEARINKNNELSSLEGSHVTT